MGQGQHRGPASSQHETPIKMEEAKNTAQGPGKARGAGNGVCTVERRRAATSNRNLVQQSQIRKDPGTSPEQGEQQR